MNEILVIGAAVGLVVVLARFLAVKKPSDVPAEKLSSSRQIRRDYKSEGTKWEKMGRDFEQFVITRFDNREYRLIEWRSDKFIHGWGGPESSRAPDILMEHIASGDRFAIECKFRSRASGNRLVWARPDQLDTYREYEVAQKIPVYVAIGLGGNPSEPENLFIIKLERMKFPDVLLYYLEKFRFPAKVTGLEFG